MTGIMEKYIGYFLMLYLWIGMGITPGWAQESRVIEDLVFTSEEGAEVAYSIYLPPDYYSNKRSYPVLYYLHGGGGNHNIWFRFGKLGQIADTMINSGQISPFIIVMPSAGPFSFYTNWKNGPAWEDAIVELFGYIDQNYRTTESFSRGPQSHASRGIAGVSMGGYGALKIAFKHPKLFKSVVSFSGAILPENLEQGEFPNLSSSDSPGMQQQMRGLMQQIFGSPFNAEYWNENNPFNLISNVENTGMKVYLICGDHDGFKLYTGAAQMQLALLDKNVSSTLEISPGGHEWDFWIDYVPKSLQFFDNTIMLNKAR